MKIAFRYVVASFAFIASAKAATVQVPVVASYERLADPKIWDGINQDETPLSAVQLRPMEAPSRAFTSQEPGRNHSKIYLQNDRMIVCYESCEKEQPSLHVQSVLKNLDANNFISGKKRDEAWKAVKLFNVYFWTNKLFDRLETLGYKPSNRLMVVVERDIADPAVGKAFVNNAFFTDKDWSLNFLPVKNSMIFSAFGMHVHSPALDPSVAMHECAHSVFQDLVGSFLNPSIMGLHEAFADYFAMAVLETRTIGVIFMSGNVVRTTLEKEGEKKVVYKPDLEAHDMGNVVNVVLQKIRALIPQKQFIDTVALETLKDLGQTPYILPTQVQSIFMTALQREAKAKQQALPAEDLARVSAFWKEYNILAPEKTETLPRSYFAGSSDNSGYFEVTTELRLDEKTAASWHLPVVTRAQTSVLKSMSGPDFQVPGRQKADSTSVFYTESLENGKTTRLWTHLSPEGLLGAYDTEGELVTPKNPLFKDVLTLNGQLGAISGFVSHKPDYGSTASALFENSIPRPGNDALRGFFKLKNQTIQKIAMTFKSLGHVEVIQRRAQIKTTILGKVLNVIAGGALSAVEEVTIYTVKSSSYPQLQTDELFPGERYLGYSSRFRTGGTQTSVISDFDPNTKSQVLPAKVP